MTKHIIFYILIIIPVLGFAQTSVTKIDAKPNDSVTVSGDLAKGSEIEDLSWAWNSSNACFPATQAAKFNGKHVLYSLTLGPRSILTITAAPDDTKANISLYGYMLGNNESYIVPNLPSCVTCEADHKWDRPWKGKVQTHERKIEFQNPTQNTYNIIIGVTSPRDAASGQPTGFKVTAKLKS